MKEKSNSPSSSQHKQLSVNAQFKFAASPGAFEGYAAVFDVVDSGGDVIEPGAFKEIEKTRDGRVLILYQHSHHDPIGKALVAQDAYGLHVRGELALDDPTAAKAYGLMRSGVLDAMSIGYAILPGGYEYAPSGVRTLKALKLFEVSIVTFPMNGAARVDAVKRVRDCQSLRELEHLLREVPHFQLSSRKAKAAAGALWPILNEREAQEGDREDREMAELYVSELNSLTTLLKGLKS